jgi:hypothetical protein
MKKVKILALIFYCFVFSFYSSLLFLLIKVSPAGAQEEEKFTRKSITYLKMVMDPEIRSVARTVDFLTGIDLYQYLESRIRKAVEIERFDYNPVSLGGDTDIYTLSKLVKQYVDEVKVDRAKAEAKMDWRFKDLVVTAEDLKKIANSAYIYSPHVKKFNVGVWISGRKKRGGIDMSISCSLGVEVVYYKVDFDTGEPILVFKTYTSHTEVVKVGEMPLLPLPFPISLFLPSIEFFETPFQAFERCLIMVVEWISKKINADMRRVPDFSLFATISSAEGQNVWAPLTKKDKVYLDSDFQVLERQEEIDESGRKKETFKRVGWVRARKIVDGKTEENSRFQIMSGSAEVGQIIREYPLVDVGFTLSFNYLPSMSFEETVSNPYLVFSEGKKGSAFGFSISGKVNTSTAFGWNISEFYLITSGLVHISRFAYEIGANLGIRKKFYLRSLGFVPQFTLDIIRIGIPAIRQEVNQEVTLSDISFGITPSLFLEWFLHPRFSIFLGGGYRLMTTAENFSYELEGVEYPAYNIRYNPSFPFISGGIEITIW